MTNNEVLNKFKNEFGIEDNEYTEVDVEYLYSITTERYYRLTRYRFTDVVYYIGIFNRVTKELSFEREG